MRNPIVYRAVRLISEAASTVPWLLYEGAAELVEHPLLSLLERPNQRQAGATFLETLYGHLLLAGNAYVELIDVGGGARELHLLRPDRVSVVTDASGWPVALEHREGTARRRVAFVGGPLSLGQVADRFAGAADVAAEHPDVFLEFVATDRLTLAHGRVAGERLLARPAATRPDAVFAANDLLALGLLQAITTTRSLRVPDDIALIGYDDIDFASATVVPLSSIRHPAHLIGYTAVDLLLKDLDDPDGDPERTVRFQPELVVRESTPG